MPTDRFIAPKLPEKSINMANDDILIKVDNVSKKFCRSLKKSLWYGLKDISAELVGQDFRHELRSDEFWALKDIHFELKRGECLGLIGPNGAGKTTLLRLLNGLIKPDHGRIEVTGQVGGLIALGAGFNPILSGRENVYINGSVLGLSKKEIDAKFDEIVAFSELEEFIDTPVQSYSSGMTVRLGFSVAVTLIQPDILLLDEVLAVGDIGFTLKCLNAVQQLMNRSAVIFVSHQLQHISRFCTRVLVLQHGHVLSNKNDLQEGLSQYLGLFPMSQHINLSDKVTVEDIELLTESESDDSKALHSYAHEKLVPHGSSAQLSFTLIATENIPGVEIKVFIDHFGATPVVAFPCVLNGERTFQLNKGEYQLRVDLGKLDLCAGKYAFSIIVMTSRPYHRLFRLSGSAPFQITGIDAEWAAVTKKATTTSKQTVTF